MYKNFSLKVIPVLVFILGFSMSLKAEQIRIVIKENLASCTGVAPMMCMQVKYKNSKSWELFYGNIAGFTYKSGYRYVLLVERTKRKNVPADASAYEFKVKKVLKRVKMKAKTNTAWDFVLKHKWKLIQMNGNSQDQSPVYITFDEKLKRVSGKSGCNNFFGGYQKVDDQLVFKQVAGTRMACSPELNKLEHEFLMAIGDKTFKYDVADQTLNLYQNDKLVLMFGMTDLK